MTSVAAGVVAGGEVAGDRSAGSVDQLSVLQLGAEWFPERGGGLNRFYFDLLHHLPRAGFRCRGLVAGTAAGWPPTDGVAIDAFAPKQAPLLKRWTAERRAVAGALSAERFDLTAAHFAPYAFPVLGPATQGRPLVVHFQGPWAQESKEEGAGRLACAAKAFIERAVYRRATRLIVLSSPFKQILVNDYGIEPARVQVVPGGVDCARFDISESRQEARAKLGWPIDRPIVLTVRRLARRMGLENLIEAAEAIRRAVPTVLIHLAGGGAQRQQLEKAIHDRGLGDTVRLLGFVPDDQLPLAYRAADVSAVPTVALEGFGLVAAESLAAGTPALATPVDGLVDLLQPLSSDLMFAGSTAGDLSAGLIRALASPASLPTAVECAAYARRRFDWSVIAVGVADVYRQAIAEWQSRNRSS